MKNIKEILLKIANKPVYGYLFNTMPSLIEENEDQRIKDLISPNLKAIEEEIDLIFFTKIKSSKNLDEANIYFDILQDIQGVLSGLFFKGKITLSGKLQKFIYDCERLDDFWLRNELFNKIKQEKYNYDFLKKYD